MKGTFLKFKRRLNVIRISRSVLAGASVGLVLSGAWLILWKLAVIDFAPIISLYIGLGSFVLTGGLALLLSDKSNKKLAEELDSQFGLKARAQTMIQYAGQEGDLVEMQRQDAERSLSKIPVKKYKFKGLWIYLLVLVLSAAVLVTGFVISDVRSAAFCHLFKGVLSVGVGKKLVLNKMSHAVGKTDELFVFIK